jgi:hypothetical protein
MEVSTAEERFGEVFGAEVLAGAAVGDHGPLPRPVHEHEDLARRHRRVARQVRPNAGQLQLFRQEHPEHVVPDPPHEVRLDA